MVGAADRIDAAAAGPVGDGRIAADDAIVEVQPVGVDAAAVGAAVAGGTRFTEAGVGGDRTVIELGDAPDGKAASPGQGVGLGPAHDRLGERIAASDGHVLHGQVAVNGQHPGVARVAAVPFERDAAWEARGVDSQAMTGVEGRSAVVAFLITRKRVVDVDLAFERRMLLANDVQQDRAAVKGAVEGDRVARRGGRDGRADGHRPGRRRGVVLQGIDDERRFQRNIVHGAAAGQQSKDQRQGRYFQESTFHGITPQTILRILI